MKDDIQEINLVNPAIGCGVGAVLCGGAAWAITGNLAGSLIFGAVALGLQLIYCLVKIRQALKRNGAGT